VGSGKLAPPLAALRIDQGPGRKKATFETSGP
jgi:hypothetical protein